MIQFNFDNNVVPSIYEDFKCSCGFCIKNDLFVPMVTIGEKYYGIFGNRCIAFKVLSISFTNKVFFENETLSSNYKAKVNKNGVRIMYELLLANGEKIFYSQHDLHILRKFHTRQDYENYKFNKPHNEVKSDVLEDTTYFKAIQDELGDLLYYNMNSVNNIEYVGLKGFCTKFGKISKCRISFEFLWVDENGVHFSALDNQSGYSFFMNLDEAKKSVLPILDFEDDTDTFKDETINVCVSIKRCDREKVLSLIKEYYRV